MLTLASLNIHQFLHREETLRALLATDADVICMQEVPESAMSELEHVLGATGNLVPMGNFPDVGEAVGVAMFVRRGLLLQSQAHRYHESVVTQPLSFSDCDRILQYAVIEKEGISYRVGHTHFVWTPNGESDERQFAAMERLLKFMEIFPDMVLCGDFNAPRGNGVWEILAKEFTDNIPPEVTTTLDEVLHRAAPLYFVVDGLFTKGRYAAHDVHVISGASDHKLITAHISA